MRGRLVLLAGFSFAFRAKNEEWRDLQLVSQMTFESQWMAERIGSTPIDQNNQMCVHFSCVEIKIHQSQPLV